MIVREALRFGLVGACNLLTYFVVYLALHLVLPYLVAHTIAYAVAIVLSFFLNCYFTYRARPTLKKFVLYPLSQVSSFLTTTVGVTVLVEFFLVDERVAPFIAAAVSIPISFLLTRLILTGRALGDHGLAVPTNIDRLEHAEETK